MTSDFFARYDTHLAAHGITITATELHQMAARGDEPKKTSAQALATAIEQVDRIEDTLRQRAAQLRSTLDRVDTSLDRKQYSSINSLGELQTTALQYDLACAQLETATNALRHAAKVFQANENSLLDLTDTIEAPTA